MAPPAARIEERLRQLALEVHSSAATRNRDMLREVDEMGRELHRATEGRSNGAEWDLALQAEALDARSRLRVLARGYAVAEEARAGVVVSYVIVPPAYVVTAMPRARFCTHVVPANSAIGIPAARWWSEVAACGAPTACSWRIILFHEINQLLGVTVTHLPALRQGDRHHIARLLEHTYPVDLRDAGQGGTVRLVLFVDAGGTIHSRRVARSSGYASLHAAARTLDQLGAGGDLLGEKLGGDLLDAAQQARVGKTDHGHGSGWRENRSGRPAQASARECHLPFSLLCRWVQRFFERSVNRLRETTQHGMLS